MHCWAEHLSALSVHQPVVMITVIAAEGSTPRDAGARMLVTFDAIEGSIGGGKLEFAETAHARRLLSVTNTLGPWHREARLIVLGPDAGQCCGGVVEVLHEVFGTAEVLVLNAQLREAKGSVITRPLTSGTPPQFVIPAKAGTQATRGERVWSEPLSPPRPKLHLYGAGHTAREIIRIAAGLPLDIAWIDIAAERFPTDQSASAHTIVTEHPAHFASTAPRGALHLAMSHSHDLDYAICEALLTRNDFAFLGLIGSATKRARFVQRFRRAGVADAALARLICPIGLESIKGKAPAVIALSAVAQLVAIVPELRD